MPKARDNLSAGKASSIRRNGRGRHFIRLECIRRKIASDDLQLCRYFEASTRHIISGVFIFIDITLSENIRYFYHASSAQII